MIAEIKSLQSNLTLEQIREKEAKLRNEVNYIDAFQVFHHFIASKHSCKVASPNMSRLQVGSLRVKLKPL